MYVYAYISIYACILIYMPTYLCPTPTCLDNAGQSFIDKNKNNIKAEYMYTNQAATTTLLKRSGLRWINAPECTVASCEKLAPETNARHA